MKLKSVVLATVLLSVPALHATSFVTLGQSNEDFVLIGQGNDANGYGQFAINIGICSPGLDTTLCILSGTYTGTTPGFTAGTYTITTTYANNEILPAILSAPGSNVFYFQPVPSDANSTISLIDNISGAHNLPIILNGAFENAFYVTLGPVTCTDLPDGTPCTMANVGANAGSSMAAQITGEFDFTAPSPSAVPEPGFLTLAGFVPLLAATLRRRY